MILIPILLFLGVNIPTAQVDISRSGANTSETTLTVANVTAGHFGKLRSCLITGDTYGQVLYMPSIGGHNLAIVGTMQNHITAIDTDTCAIVWDTTLGTPWATYSTCCTGNETFYGAAMGVITTPVVDTSALKIYVVNAISTPAQVLSRIDLATGAVEATRTITGSSGGATFATVDNMQVAALALSADGSKVYLTFGGWENGSSPYHGWVMAYNTASTMTQIAAFCTTPTGSGGSPWMSRGGPAIDGSGNVYVVTGNGDWDGVNNFGQSVLKFSSTLSLLDWFTESNWSSNNAVDADLSAGRFMLIPATTLGVVAGKDFNVFVVDTTCMGHLQGSGGCSLQTFKTLASGTPAAFTGSFGSVLMNNVLYLPITTGPLYAFTFSAGSFNTTPTFLTTSVFGGHNGQISGSANGGSNGIVWVTTSTGSSFTTKRAGTLRALNAATGAPLWDSDARGFDNLGTLAKFADPTIVDGMVIVPNLDGQIIIYGAITPINYNHASSN